MLGQRTVICCDEDGYGMRGCVEECMRGRVVMV